MSSRRREMEGVDRPWQSYHTVYTNAKAGMEGVDKEKVQRIIYEASKGSKYFENEQRKEAFIKQKIENLQAQCAKLTDKDISHFQSVADQKILELEASRDLTKLWLHSDMDAFYAAVETLDDPSLKGKPLAVGSMSMICTANYEARKFGVRAAMPGFIGHKLCPNLIFVPTNFKKYTYFSELTRNVFRKYDPEFIATSLDEAYLNITETCIKRSITSEEVAAELRNAIYQETGLTCSIGVAPNRLLAKVCSDINKPNGQFILPNDRDAVMTFILSLPIRKIGGIGKVTEHILRDVFGISTCEEMLQKGALLCALFSDCSTDFFLSVGLGLGRTDTPEHKLRKSISCERTFTPCGDASLLFQQLADIAETLSCDMQKEWLWGRNLTLKLKTASFEVRTRAVSMQKYINSKDDILLYASKLLKAELPLSLRLIGLRMSQFGDDKHSSLDPTQTTLTRYAISGDTNSRGKETWSLKVSEEHLLHDSGSNASLHQQSSLSDDNLFPHDDKENLLEYDEPAILKKCICSGDIDDVEDRCLAKWGQDPSSLQCESSEGTGKLNNIDDHQTLASSGQMVKPSWIDGYICSLCGIELPPSFEDERQEHLDYHLAEALQEEEAMQNWGHLKKGRSLQKASHATSNGRKKQKASSKEGKQIPIDAFFSKGKKASCSQPEYLVLIEVLLMKPKAHATYLTLALNWHAIVWLRKFLSLELSLLPLMIFSQILSLASSISLYMTIHGILDKVAHLMNMILGIQEVGAWRKAIHLCDLLGFLGGEKMESYLNENFGGVKAKNSSEEALRRWRKLCGVVKNPKRRFRFTANLSKRSEAEAMKRTNQEKLRVAVLVSKAALQFIHGITLRSEYVVPQEVKAAGFEICADELGSIVEGHDLKKLKMHGGVDGIVSKLSTSTTDGLSTAEDRLKLRQEIYGLNKFTETKMRSFWEFVWDALQDTTLIILAVCAFVSLIVGIVMEGWPKGAHDGLGIVASILLVVSVTATSDYRQSLQFKDLDKEKKKISIQVTRNGFRQKISIYDLLPGDIAHLAIGDQIPADGLFVTGFSLLINESSLTGESEPVIVNAENPFLLSGTKVQDGTCKMLITTVGMRTQWGKLMSTLSEGGDDETPLQVKLNGVASIIGRIGLFFAVVTFAVLAQGLISRKFHQDFLLNWSGDDALELLEYFAIAVTIVVVAVPEGLPLAVTLSLAFAMKKMMNDKALVRHLAACETMGSATSICSDKTGTLTTNHMTVVKACICRNIEEVSSPEKAINFCSQTPDVAVKTLLQSIFNNTGGEVVMNRDGKLEILGTPTETALLEFGLSLGGEFQAKRQETKIVKVEPFNSVKKRMGVVLQLPEGGYRAHSKGASEIVLAACDKFIDSTGTVVSLDEAAVNHLASTIESFASEALRTLCLAYKDIGNEFSVEQKMPVEGYTCIGIVGIKDPVRPGVNESVAICRSAGITVRMVTGDNINTAKAIARECGILTDGGLAIEGPEFREKSLEELIELIPRIQVMARSSPLDKHTLVKHLRTTFNEVVAVTGDGTNDAPALHEADIGLAMGISGTEVAKESADVIILDDNFSTIATVAKWGRSVYINIQKFVQFQLTVNVVALVVNFSSACFRGNAPLTAVQLLWVNMIMDTLGALALATEPPNDDLMKRSPVGRTGKFISNTMWRNILGQSFYQFIIIWYLQTQGKRLFGLEDPGADLTLNTIIFNSFVFCQVFNEISSREMEKIDVFTGILKNYVFVGVLTSTVLFQVIIVQFLGDFANTTPLTRLEWFASVFIGFLGMPIAAAIKLIPVGAT
ncbi:calcium-transporting ATPase 10, plasma membrane-type-like [Typha latifolia]|uniref:calcium-transporting ATPase 10, plasma membrane-type-like n=1 Tax=Typha latifolia TaxID=4733 RepID=UPI003C2F758E